MSDKKSVQIPKDNILISDKTGNGAAAQLAEEELEQVVGGYIGETEKNLTRPIRESAVFWSDWCVRTPPLTRRTGLPSAFHRLTTGTLQRA